MSTTISDNYRQQQKKLHENPNYGVASLSFAPIVWNLMKTNDIKSISDYGAGKQNLKKALDKLADRTFDYFPYDPAFEDYGKPTPAEMACCIDVLEHIEEEFLSNVLNDLARITQKVGFFTIHTGPAQKVLDDGRNAHIIQQPSSWWLPKLCEHFNIIHLQGAPGGFWVVATPK